MATVTSSIFRSSTKTRTIQPLTETINWFSLPKHDLTQKQEELYRGWLALMIIKEAQARNVLMEPEDAIAYIVTVTELIFPGTVAQLTRDRVGNFASTSFQHDVRAVFDTVQKILADQENESEGEEEESAEESKHSEEIPVIDVGFNEIAIDVELAKAGLIGAAARWGIEIFPIGKNVSAANITGYRVNRVAALQRSLKVESDFPAFQEPLLPQLDVLRSVERAWDQYKAIRLAMASTWAQMVQDGAPTRAANAFLVTFQLTDGFGLGAPAFITDLLSAYPELENFPELRPQIRVFLQALEIFSREPPELRGFVKVRYGANYRLFASSNRGALLAVAVAFRRQSDSTAGRFINITPWSDTIARVNNYLKSLGLSQIADVGITGSSTGPTMV